MNWQKKRSQEALSLLQSTLKTTHGKILLCGLLVGLCYFPAWLEALVLRAGGGSGGLLLVPALVYLGLNELWKHRRQLAETEVLDEDRLIGHTLILGGVLLFPFCRFELWSQALLWLLVLAGIACSAWGIGFFKKYMLTVVLMVLSAYPRPGEIVQGLWETLTPPQSLNHFAAWAGTLALRAIGLPATVDNVFILLPEGAVQVGWGCNGISMASHIAVMGLILGLIFKQSWKKVVALMLFGAILAFVLNVPRIMLVTYASVYWGEYWFNFWHVSWGAQIFSGVMFTVYYYVVLYLVNRPVQRA